MIVRFERNGKIKYGWAVEDRIRVIEGNIFAAEELTVMTGLEIPLNQVRLDAPCAPKQVIMVNEDLSYHSLPANGIIGPSEKMVFPALSSSPPNYGLAIGIVMKRDAKEIQAIDVDDYVMGMTNVLTIGSCEQLLIGPGIVPKLKLGEFKMKLTVNGQTNHSLNMGEWKIDLAKWLEQLTASMTLYAGDILIIDLERTAALAYPEDQFEVVTDGFLIPLATSISY
ncbi:MAG TPA: fumarylacetoacetate hydrolase family protein [Bacillota bacterium]|nr:fumarylacetoacetate hydrolase family protein [Bacillota bacterium]